MSRPTAIEYSRLSCNPGMLPTGEEILQTVHHRTYKSRILLNNVILVLYLCTYSHLCLNLPIHERCSNSTQNAYVKVIKTVIFAGNPCFHHIISLHAPLFYPMGRYSEVIVLYRFFQIPPPPSRSCMALGFFLQTTCSFTRTLLTLQ
jgi:hypothetical protein